MVYPCYLLLVIQLMTYMTRFHTVNLFQLDWCLSFLIIKLMIGSIPNNIDFFQCKPTNLSEHVHLSSAAR